MMKMVLAAALLALSACATPDPVTGAAITWRCDGGASFTAQDTEGGDAVVTAGGRTYHVRGVMAASGERFTGGGVEYWQHGDEAMLNGAQGGPYANCKQ